MRAAVAWYVACSVICYLLGIPAYLLSGGRRSLGCLSGNNWRYAGRPQGLGRPASFPSGSISWRSSSTRWQSFDADPSQPGGVGIQGSSKAPLRPRRRRCKSVDRSKPVGITGNYTKHYITAGSFYIIQRGQDEVHSHPRSVRRFRISDRDRHGEGQVDAEIHRCHWGTAVRRNRAHKGAAQCVAPQGASVGKSAVRRFFGVYAFRKEDVSIYSLSHLHSEFGRNFPDAGSPWSKQLHSVVSLFPGVESGYGDVGLHPHCTTSAVRDPHREVGEALPYMLAPGGQCGGQGEIRSPREVAVEGDAGPPDWQINSDGLGSSCPVLGASLQATSRRSTFLGGECAQSGIGLVGSWIKGPPEDAIRAGGIVGAFWRRTIAEDREGTSIVSYRFDNANQKTTSEQRSKRGPQEEVESRSRRTYKIARRPFNLFDKRKRKGKSKRANLLFLEHWKSTLWWFASWLHLPRQGGSASQVFEMWLSRPPFEGLQSRVNQWTKTHPADGGSPSSGDFGAHGDGRQGGDRKRRREGEDREEDEHQRGDPREKALDEAKIPDLEEYMRERTFVFLHHFSGPEDRLSIAIQREAARRGGK